MPLESIVFVAAVIAMFGVFAGTLAWASRETPKWRAGGL